MAQETRAGRLVPTAPDRRDRRAQPVNSIAPHPAPMFDLANMAAQTEHDDTDRRTKRDIMPPQLKRLCRSMHLRHQSPARNAQDLPTMPRCQQGHNVIHHIEPGADNRNRRFRVRRNSEIPCPAQGRDRTGRHGMTRRQNGRVSDHQSAIVQICYNAGICLAQTGAGPLHTAQALRTA